MPQLEILQHPQMLHAMVVHFPVALAILGIPLVYFCALAEHARPILLRVALGGYILLALFALLAAEFGEQAMAQVPGSAGPAALAMIDNHREMAEKLWMLAAGTAAFLALSLIRFQWVRNTALALAMIASIAVGLWVAVVGHLGGTLVYQYGVGTPAMTASFEAVPPAPSEAISLEYPPIPDKPQPPITTPSIPENTAKPLSVENRAPLPLAEAPEPTLPVPAPNTVSPPLPAETPAPPEMEAMPEAAFPQPETAPPSPPAEEAAEPVESTGSEEQEALLPVHPIEPELAAQVSYTKDVKPIFERHCTACHNPSSASGGLDLTSVASMLKPGEESGAAVTPGRPGQSAIVRYIRGELQPQMPKGGAPLSEGELHVIREWIAAGAADDTPAPMEKTEAPAMPEPPTRPAPVMRLNMEESALL